MRSDTGKLDENQRQKYLEGLKRYSDRGIPIFIDGELCEPEDCACLFELREDGAFYMGDYVGADIGRLEEIHFDKVYFQ